MDLATILGLLLGMSLVVGAILMGGSAKIFFNIPGIVIVAGGSFSTLFIKFPMKAVFNTLKVTMNAFIVRETDPKNLIEEIVELSTIARKNGILALEQQQMSNSFLKQAINYCVDGYEKEFIEASMLNDIQTLRERHETGQKIFKGLGDVAPAFGMIGTLIGLVQMLATMDDPSSIGPAMAVALLTTFYGALLANLVFLPLADKLELRSGQEVLQRSLIVDGVVALQDGMSPSMLRGKLQAYLAPKDRTAQ